MDQPMSALSCSFYLKIDRPVAEVFAAVQRADQLSQYFAFGAKGDLAVGASVTWQFHDFPEAGDMPVRVIAVEENSLIHLQWESTVETEWNDVKITFENLDDPNQTLVRVVESGWPPTDKGIKGSVDNAGGWANMLTCLKVWLEHGVRLRERMF